MTDTVATPTAAAAPTIPQATVRSLVAEIGTLLTKHPRGLPRIPLVAQHAGQVRDAIVARCRVLPWCTDRQWRMAETWAAHFDAPIEGAQLGQVRSDHRMVETLVAVLWPREGRGA